jgi:hypothetical protein
VSQNEPEIEEERVQRLVLARLMIALKKPLSLGAVVADIAAAISPPLSSAAARSAASRAIEHCQQAGYVTPKGPPLLTAAGDTAVTAAFGPKARASVKNWRQAQQVAALSASGHSVDKPLDADALAARVLAEQHGLPTSIRSAAKAVDRMAWRQLGLETDAAFTINAVQRHLLREFVPADTRVTQEVWRRMLAMRAIGASGHDANALTRALFFQPTKPNGRHVTQQTVRNDNDRANQIQPSLADFAQAVQRAAAGPDVTRFHDDRAFIGSVWERMRGHNPVGDMSLEDFKAQLVAAHRQRLLRITRADLVGAMDPAEVQRSEARYQDATFHFVALDAGGVR